MQISNIDWAIMIAFAVLTLGIGVAVSRQAGKNSGEYFLSGRTMPWWLLGFSMVATTFSTDTPNFVTGLVRSQGVWANWMWWAFVVTGMMTVFIYAKLWRRSEVLTDVEFYELRYSGKAAAFLRGFRALYLGVIFNITIMAGVSLAVIKIGGVMLGLPPAECVVWAMVVTVIFSSLGGFKGVILTDFFLFILAMVGSIAAAYFAIQHPNLRAAGVSSLGDLFQHESVRDQLSLVPTAAMWDSDMTKNAVVTLFVMPLVVQWWAVWYPGAEPGGGGYLAQRMLAAKNEKHAIGATLFFQVVHYAVRPWPWIIVALASMVAFPLDKAEDRKIAEQRLEQVGPHLSAEEKRELQFKKEGLTALRAAYPASQVPDDKVQHDLAYSAMLTSLPVGWMGVVLTSLLAAYMSTISTHLNWGSSYVVNDFYQRFVRPGASQAELVWVGRLSTVGMMVLTAILALSLTSAQKVFELIIQMGAGTGLLFILRWFWWRINPWSELTAMVVSLIMAFIFHFHEGLGALPEWQKILMNVGITTACWLIVTYLTKPSDMAVLRRFVEKTNPGGPGWASAVSLMEKQGPINVSHDRVNLPMGLVNVLLGCVVVYGILFGSGLWLYGQKGQGHAFLCVGLAAGYGLSRTWKKATS